jgi:excisionase family DNA binding protein
MLSEQKFVSVQEAADIFRVHKMTVYRMLERSRGTPGAFKVGGCWRLDVNALERFFEAATFQTK